MEAPSKSGLGTEILMREKPQLKQHSVVTKCTDLSPGFKSFQPKHQFRTNVSNILLVKWRCPSHILLNPQWFVAGGEESEEIEVQNRRIYGMIETFYPLKSALPPNPAVSSKVQQEFYDDSQTPHVPTTASEDEEVLDEIVGMAAVSTNLSTDHHKQFTVEEAQHVYPAPSVKPEPAVDAELLVEPDISAAAAAAFTAIMMSSEKGSMVDRDLLIKILSDPSLIDQLLKEHGEGVKLDQLDLRPAIAEPPLHETNTRSLSMPSVSSATSSMAKQPAPAVPIDSEMGKLTSSWAAPVPAPPATAPFAQTFQALSVPPNHVTGLPQSNISQPIPLVRQPPIPATVPSNTNKLPSFPIPTQFAEITCQPQKAFCATLSLNPTAPQPKMITTPASIEQVAVIYDMNLGMQARPPVTNQPLVTLSALPHLKDKSYYKSLIQQHGIEKNGSCVNSIVPPPCRVHQSGNGGNSSIGTTNATNIQRLVREKSRRPCVFFNTPTGCRLGVKCFFRHDAGSSDQQLHRVKRYKMDGSRP